MKRFLAIGVVLVALVVALTSCGTLFEIIEIVELLESAAEEFSDISDVVTQSPSYNDTEKEDEVKDTEMETQAHRHSFGKWTVVYESTCTSQGLERRVCNDCGEKEESVIDTLDHVITVDAAVEATCTSTGLTEGKHCSLCETIFVEQVTVAATGHDYSSVVTAPTSTQQGYTTHTCENCGDTYVDSYVSAVGSVGLAYTLNADNLTCTVTGIGECTDTEIVIPSEIDGYTVTTIGDRAFSTNTSITAIFIPDTIISIGARAFYGCTGITEMTIPASVTKIGTQIIYKCDALNTLNYNSIYYNSDNTFLLDSSVEKIVFGGTAIPANILKNCTTVKNIEIKDNVKSIGNSAFYNCDSLISVIIGNGVTGIGDYAFYDCENLTDVALGSGVKGIGEEAFGNCDSLKNVYITDIVNWCKISFYKKYFLGANPLSNGANLYVNGELLTELVIPDEVTSIKDYAFQGCTSIESVTIPDTVTNIGKWSFYECTGLVNIAIPDSVTSIGEYAFVGCYNIPSIRIPDSVTSIGSAAFLECYKLVEVINMSYLNINKGESTHGMLGYYALEIHNGESKIVNQNGYLFYTYEGENYLLGYVGEETPLILPSDYNGNSYDIYKYAFYANKEITSVTIPDGVTTIGGYAFRYCSSLTEIIFKGTEEQWNAIYKGPDWDYFTGNYTVIFEADN